MNEMNSKDFSSALSDKMVDEIAMFLITCAEVGSVKGAEVAPDQEHTDLDRTPTGARLDMEAAVERHIIDAAERLAPIFLRAGLQLVTLADAPDATQPLRARAVSIVQDLTKERRGSNAFKTGDPRHEDIYARFVTEAFIRLFADDAHFDSSQFREECKLRSGLRSGELYYDTPLTVRVERRPKGRRYRILNVDTGVHLGVWEASSEQQALDYMAQAAGYQDHAHAEKVAPGRAAELTCTLLEDDEDA